MNPSALSAAALQRGGMFSTICPACGSTFEARSLLAVYCSFNCKSRAAYHRRKNRDNKQTLAITPQVVQPEIVSAPANQPPVMPFAFDGRQIRVIKDEQDDPWFVAADLLALLGLDRKALERLDADEKGVSSIHTPGGAQAMTTVNEFGLYSLILGSRKPEAKRFKRWVTHEVLPTIRRTGRYDTRIEPQLPKLPPSGSDILIRAKTRQEAAQVWADALEKATASAIRRMYSTRYRPDNANRSWIYCSHLPV